MLIQVICFYFCTRQAVFDIV